MNTVSEKLFYFVVSGAVSATSRQKAEAALESVLGRDSIMTADIEGLRQIRSQHDIDAVNQAVCKDCIADAIAKERRAGGDA